MAGERQDEFPYNAGIIFMNMAYLRETYNNFVEWIMNQRNGFIFWGSHTLDQGAINSFYENQIRPYPQLPQNYNSKLYRTADFSIILHFHGPKPVDIRIFVEEGHCTFGDLCGLAIKHSACKYANYLGTVFPHFNSTKELNRACKSRPFLKRLSSIQHRASKKWW